jgi:hypothetical protein
VRVTIAIVALGGAFFGCLVLVRAVRPRSAALAAPLALALLVCLETAILRGLSALHAVAAAPIALANLAVLGAGSVVAWRVPSARLRRPRLARAPWIVLGPLAILFALAAVSALAYLPNNWDSMTYHLARVAHWIQHRSVEPYPTGIARQNVLTPGAEYLLLVLQSIGGTDRLAALVQLGAWVALVGATVPLARSFGATRGVTHLGALVVGAAPMAVLQASSTQNDLVAAAMAAALVAAAMPFLHRERRWRQGDLVLLVVAGAGAVLVKPTALLVTAPLLAWAGLGLARTALAGGRRALREIAPAAVLVIALAAPLAATARAGSAATRSFVYAGTSPAELADRARNAVRGVVRNLPFTEALGDPLAPQRTEGCALVGRLCLFRNREAHEDLAGNPALAALALLAVASAAFRSSAPARARRGAVVLVLGWATFHGVLRDNAWITRLQLPAAALMPLALGALARSGPSRARVLALGIVGTLALAHGVRAAVLDARRPLRSWEELRRGGAPAAYYNGAPVGLDRLHEHVLEALGRSGCRRLGLAIGGDSYDYPLTWRAMQRGIEVRHVAAPDDWPCAIFSDLGPPPPRPDGVGWRRTSAAGLFEAISP